MKSRPYNLARLSPNLGLASWVKGGWSILMLALQVHRGHVQHGGYGTLP